MPKTLLSARLASLTAFFTALIIAVGAAGAVATASASARSTTTHKHRVTTRKHRATKHKATKHKVAKRKHKVAKHPKKKTAKTATVVSATAASAQAPSTAAAQASAAASAQASAAASAQASATASAQAAAAAQITAAATSAPTPTDSTAPAQPLGISGNWNLALDSNFEGSSLTGSPWRTGWFGSGVTGPANTAEEDCYSPSNVTFPGDGTMHLNVTATPSTCNGETEPYTGALVSTNPSDGRTTPGYAYTYGVLEAKVYIPADGTQIANWPAVWADGQSWPADGEDDLLEGLGGQACFHFHSPLGGPGACDSTLTPGWHTFASDWQPGSVTYYYDGVEVGSITTGITNSPMYVILNNTVSSQDPGLAEADSMQVAYVRVWQ